MKTALRLFMMTIALLIFSDAKVHAAHLVGGEISYVCVGGNQYRIKLRVYRDCASGGAQFDALAALAIYDSLGLLVNHLMLSKGPTISVPTDSTGNPCVSAPPGLCTEYAEYIDTVFLPPAPGGYVITHQRCCRNSSISNVQNSGSFGNTYTVRIPSQDTTCNSSPQFNGIAPVVLCLNEGFSLPMNVSEADGDSLHYELCEVLNGGGQSGGAGCNAIIPNPPCAPPYSAVSFVPPYSSSNPMPSANPIGLDSISGVLSGKPTQVGQYLVGICVTEFRNGKPLSTVRLDYQFNVTNCIVNVVSDMLTPIEDPDILCTGLEVNFRSQSRNANRILWDFGDPLSNTDTSSIANPTYLYSMPGRYEVKLYANPGEPCGDTSRFVFEVRNILKPEIRDSGIFCFEAQEVYFRAAGNYPVTATYNWDFGPEASITNSLVSEPPPIRYSSPGKHYVRLSVSDKGCTESAIDSVFISNLSVTVDAGPDRQIPAGEVVELSATGGTSYYWWASEPVDFANPWGRETSAELRPESDTVTFYVRVTDELGCGGVDSVQITVTYESRPINFFTPNGDGINDLFDLSDLNPEKDSHLRVMNRWGVEVYFEDNYDNAWNGVTRGGQELPDGTYYYILSRNNQLIWKDAVSILRSNR